MTMSCRDGKLYNHSTDFGAKSADYCASAISIENAGNIGDHGIGKKTRCFFYKRNFIVSVLFSQQHEAKTFSILNFGIVLLT